MRITWDLVRLKIMSVKLINIFFNICLQNNLIYWILFSANETKRLMNTYYLRTPTCTRQTSEVHVYLHSQGIEAVTTWKNAAGGQSRTGTWEHYMSSPANHQLCCLKKNNEIMIIFEEYMQVHPLGLQSPLISRLMSPLQGWRIIMKDCKHFCCGSLMLHLTLVGFLWILHYCYSKEIFIIREFKKWK